MKRSVLTFTIAATVGFSSLIAGDTASAESLKDLQSKRNKVQQDRSGVNADINKADLEIKRLQAEQEKIKQEIQRIDTSINETNEKIAEKNKQIEDKTKEIEKLKGDISDLVARIDKRNELLKDRARSFQEGGGAVSYLDVLLGAKSFSDFIDRVGAVNTIMEADQDILTQHKEDQQTLEELQKKMEDELAQLETMRSELQEMQKTLEKQRAEKDAFMAKLKVQEQQTEQEKLSLKEEEEILAAQEAAIQQAIQLEEKRLEEEAKRRAEAEAAARAQAQAQAKEQGNGQAQASAKAQPKSSGGNNGGGGKNVSAAPPVSSGIFTRPASGYISSYYGPRWGGFHRGIDIAKRGTVPVVAAADGVVIRSYYSDSYGHAVFISHSINGKVYTTVYAHLDSRFVQDDQRVSKGQFIGYMGNTGDSRGQHLHFEIHEGPWNGSKSNAVDPL
ncbi:peptidoglycan DD-metalloendopeptidase family protein [Bacillus aquiflavi]|nr:peptidoglycan DD-metalloendopeptidase family protein [Bacillus aquiflavi]UAC47843.1 peptidoglycan DD-metalloendopeptidase family protein [Bacillus aquiflavi]